jgi:hypothetical protein
MRSRPAVSPRSVATAMAIARPRSAISLSSSEANDDLKLVRATAPMAGFSASAPAWTSSSLTTGASRRPRSRSAAICSRSSRIATGRPDYRQPANSRPASSTTTSGSRSWPTRSAIDCSTTRTVDRWSLYAPDEHRLACRDAHRDLLDEKPDARSSPASGGSNEADVRDRRSALQPLCRPPPGERLHRWSEAVRSPDRGDAPRTRGPPFGRLDNPIRFFRSGSPRPARPLDISATPAEHRGSGGASAQRGRGWRQARARVT